MILKFFWVFFYNLHITCIIDITLRVVNSFVVFLKTLCHKREMDEMFILYTTDENISRIIVKIIETVFLVFVCALPADIRKTNTMARFWHIWNSDFFVCLYFGQFLCHTLYYFLMFQKTKTGEILRINMWKTRMNMCLIIVYVFLTNGFWIRTIFYLTK